MDYVFLIFCAFAIFYTIKLKLNEIVSNDKLIRTFRNLKIRNTETFKINFWSGDLKIYENIMVIESGTYSLHIVLDKKEKKTPMTVSLKQVSIINNTLILYGIKHRVLGDSNIKIRIKSYVKNEIIDIKDI